MNITGVKFVETNEEWWDLLFKSEEAVDISKALGARNGRIKDGILYLMLVENGKLLKCKASI